MTPVPCQSLGGGTGRVYGGGMKSQEIQLTALPDSTVTAANFGVFDAEAPEPGPGQVLVAVRRLGLNAGLASRIGSEGTAYGPGIGVGDTPASDAVVEVIESASDAYAVGDLAVGKVHWRSIDVCDAGDLRRIGAETEDLAWEDHLTILGHVGFTAYTGMIHVAQVQAGEDVYITGAGGGVGSCAVQFAKARGARVIGCVGSAEKVELVTRTLGADAAVNRHDGPALDLLRQAAPDGIDLYYDNVGGEQLEAALEMLRHGGRVVICGAVAKGTGAGAPRNYTRLIYGELTMRGFTVTEHEDLRPQFEAEVGQWVREGTVRGIHTGFTGIESLPRAFESLLAGTSEGRVIVAMDRRH